MDRGPLRAIRKAMDWAVKNPWKAAKPQMGSYAVYCLFHLAVGLFLSINGIFRARRRNYHGIIAKRLLITEPPPRKGEWTAIYSGGIGELRVAKEIAKSWQGQAGADVVVLTQDRRTYEIPSDGLDISGAPFNNPLSAWLFLRKWRPKAIAVIEFFDNTHLKVMARLMRVPVMVVNVPISKNATKRVARKNELWRWMLLDGYLCQAEEHKERVQSLGVPPERCAITGPIGLALNRPEESESEEMRQTHELKGAHPVIVAGSTHPEEEPTVLAAFGKLKQKHPQAALILAPRNMRRPEGITSCLDEAGLTYARRSEKEKVGESGILLLDTYGELKHTYGLADMAYVGATFHIFIGGHTPIESIAWGVPVLMGPEHEQQRVIVEELAEAGCAFVCGSEDELAAEMIRLAEDEAALDAAQAAAEKMRQDNDERTLAVYQELIADHSES